MTIPDLDTAMEREVKAKSGKTTIRLAMENVHFIWTKQRYIVMET
jgi:hypothetical protein